MSVNQTHAEFDEEEARHYRGVLRRLVDIAMDEAANIQAEQLHPGASKPDRSLRFEPVARTIRRCILLARKLAEPLPTSRVISARDQSHPETKAEDAGDRQAKRPGAEPLDTDRPDRLDAPEPADDLTRRSIHEIVAEIARGLGVGPAETEALRWEPTTPEPIQPLNVRTAAPPGHIKVWLPENQHAPTLQKPQHSRRP